MKNPFNRSVYGVGYLGLGKHVADTEGQGTVLYKKWQSMLERGYCNKYKSKNPTYNNATVCEEWKCLQNFGDWFEKKYIQNFHLDKDILVKGNKLYSPETCCFVPAEINSLFTNHTLTCPEDMKIRKGYEKYRVRININKKLITLGSFDTPEEAFQAYKIAKEGYIKELAQKWKDILEPRVYKALCYYEI